MYKIDQAETASGAVGNVPVKIEGTRATLELQTFSRIFSDEMMTCRVSLP